MTEIPFLCWDLHSDEESNIFSGPEPSGFCLWATEVEVCTCLLLGTCAQAVPLLRPEGEVMGAGSW